MSEVLATWRKNREVVLCDEPVGEAAARILEGLAMAKMTIDAPTTDDLTDAAALVEARFKPIAGPLADVTPLADAEREQLVRSFLADELGARFADDPAAWFVLDVIVGYRCSQGLDPLRWSGGAAELFLLDWVPER